MPFKGYELQVQREKTGMCQDSLALNLLIKSNGHHGSLSWILQIDIVMSHDFLTNEVIAQVILKKYLAKIGCDFSKKL